MCGGGGHAPTQPTVDPAAERQAAADEAAKKANAALANSALRRRGQAGLLSTDQGQSVLASALGGAAGGIFTKGVQSVLSQAMNPVR